MADYRLVEGGEIAGQTAQVLQRLRDGAFIPADPRNSDYRDYLASGETAQLAPQ